MSSYQNNRLAPKDFTKCLPLIIRLIILHLEGVLSSCDLTFVIRSLAFIVYEMIFADTRMLDNTCNKFDTKYEVPFYRFLSLKIYAKLSKRQYR